MNSNKVIFIDVDQTLFDNFNNILYDSTILAMKRLFERKDIDVFLATGRGIKLLDHLKEILPYFKGFVTNNGQTVFYENKIIYDEETPKELVEKLEDYANTNKISIAYVTEYDAIVNFHNEISKRALDNFHIHNSESLEKEKCPKDLKVKQFWFFGNHQQIAQARKAIPELDFINWPGKLGCDVIKTGISKKNGIEKVLELLNYDYNNTYAIGDGDNDIGMFKAVKTSIAMGNGTKNAKANATYITDSIDNDGFLKAIEKYILK